MGEKQGRGRPPTYSSVDRMYLAELIRQHGIAGARRHAKFPVCQQTLAKIAHEYGIVLSKGRRSKSAA